MGMHYIFFADDLGIASTFPDLKNRLSEPGEKHVSLLYYSAGNSHQFEKELEILRKHYPASLWISYYQEKLTGYSIIPQEEIEAVLNANTMQQMSFIISGNEPFTEKVRETLLFLGMEKVQIQEQHFSE